MISLVRAELRRITSRRIVRILMVILLAVLVLVIGRVGQLSKRLDQADRVRMAAEQTEEARAQCRQFSAFGEPGASSDPSAPFGPGGQDPCESFVIGPDDIPDQRLKATDGLRGGVIALGTIFPLVALIVGASYVGADWNHGTMQALLFWEPRRGRVLAAKAVALVLVAVATMLALQLLVYALVYLIAATRGTTEGMTGGIHVANVLTALRACFVAAVMALLGFSVSGLSRYTAAALGGAAGYFAVVENLIRVFRPGWQRFLFGENISAVLNKSVEVAPASGRRAFQFEEFGPQMYRLTGVRGAITLGIYLALLLGGFYYTFSRRDVT